MHEGRIVTDTSQQVAASKRGRGATALEIAFARYQSEILGTLYFLLGNFEDARDALQETFVKCWRHRRQVPQVENLRAWIFRVALNTGRDLRQTAWRRRRQPLSAEEQTTKPQEAPLAVVEQNEQIGRLREAVRSLREEEQEVFLARQNGDLTYEQIAEVIGVPTGTVKTRMRLALAKLRAALAEA